MTNTTKRRLVRTTLALTIAWATLAYIQLARILDTLDDRYAIQRKPQP